MIRERGDRTMTDAVPPWYRTRTMSLPPLLPAPVREWLHELGWPRHRSFQAPGSPAIVPWVLDRLVASDGALDEHAVVPLVEELLVLLPDPFRADEAGVTPLHQAAHARLPRLVERFLAAGAPVDARDGLGRTPLCIAINACSLARLHWGEEDDWVWDWCRPDRQEGRNPDLEDIVDRLLAAGADVHAANEDGAALVAATSSGSLRLVTRLLDEGLDPSRCCLRASTTPLMAFLMAPGRPNHQEIFEALMVAGVDASWRAADGRSALIHALRSGVALGLIGSLLAAGASVIQEAPDRFSPVVTAALYHPTALPCVLAAGGNPGDVWEQAPGVETDAPLALARNWVLGYSLEFPRPGMEEAMGLLHDLVARGASLARLDAYLDEGAEFNDEDEPYRAEGLACLCRLRLETRVGVRGLPTVRPVRNRL